MVTITGGLARLAQGGFGVEGVAGATIELQAVHPGVVRPGYGFGDDLIAERPAVIPLGIGGGIEAGVTVLASASLRPAGSHHRVTWVLPANSDGVAERITYDLWIGPDGGTCDITDPANWIGTGEAPVLAGWPPDLPPVPVYFSEGGP